MFVCVPCPRSIGVECLDCAEKQGRAAGTGHSGPAPSRLRNELTLAAKHVKGAFGLPGIREAFGDTCGGNRNQRRTVAADTWYSTARIAPS